MAVIVCCLAACGPDPAPSPEPTGAPETETADPLVNRVWMRDDPGNLPGRQRIFLDDGVLLSGSCWEPYRLSKWRRDGDERVIWTEDGVEIPAQVLELTPSGLRLRLALVSGTAEESYRLAETPWVCPDVPR